MYCVETRVEAGSVEIKVSVCVAVFVEAAFVDVTVDAM